MPVPKVVRSINDLFIALNDRVRRLELGETGAVNNKIGAWDLVEDRATGNLVAIRNNGQGTTPSIVILALK